MLRKPGSTWLATALASFLAGAPGALAQESSPPPELELKPGDSVPSFSAEGINGQTYTVEFPKDTSTVLLFFLSGCPTCHKMIPEWNRAFDKKPAKLKVLGIMLDHEPPGFFDVTPVSFPVLRAQNPRELARLYKVSHVPTTVRVKPGGVIEDVAGGLLDPIRLGQLFHP